MRKIIFSFILTIGASFAYDACDNERVKRILQYLNDITAKSDNAYNKNHSDTLTYTLNTCENNTIIQSGYVLYSGPNSDEVIKRVKQMNASQKKSIYRGTEKWFCGLVNEVSALKESGIKYGVAQNFINDVMTSKTVVDMGSCRKYGY